MNKLVQQFLEKTTKRSLKAYKNMLGLFVVKGLNVGVSFLMVPLALGYLDQTRYGIWITLYGIFNWFSLFDIGLGNGLRNRLTEALANKDLFKAKVLISTTYAALILIFAALFAVFAIINNFLDWTILLNTPTSFREELNLLAAFVFFFFCMRFAAQLVTSVALAKQDPALSQTLELIGRIMALAGVFLLTIYTEGSILYLGVVLTAVPVFTVILLSIILYLKKYRDICPSIKLIRFKELNNVLNLGLKFFIIQIAAIIFYQTNNFIIAQLFGPSEVTSFDISFQYFGIATIGFMTILIPYWSAITDAFTRGDIVWIKNVVKNLKLIWIGLLGLVIALYLLSDFLVDLWLGGKIEVQKDLYFVMGLYVLVNAFNAIYSQFLNGVGKVMIQFYIALSLAIIHIPLAIFFSQHFGIKGMLFSTIGFGVITIFIYNLQYKKILNGTAKGIWNK